MGLCSRLKNMKSYSRGIAKAQAATIIVALIIAGAAGFYLIGTQPQNQQSTSQSSTQSSTQSTTQSSTQSTTQPTIDPRLAAAKGEGGLTIYSSVDVADFAVIQKAFEVKYPDLAGKITFLNMRPPEAYSRITSELQGGKPTADMVILSYTTAQQLQKDKLFMAYKSKELSGYSASLYDANGTWASAILLPVGFGYNTQLVSKADVPKTLSQVTDPKWAGKVEYHTLIGGSVGTQYVSSMKECCLNDADYNAFLSGLKAVNAKPSTSVSAISDDLAKGEVAIGVAVYLHDITRLKGQGAPVDFFLPQGIPLLTVPSTISIMKGVTSPNLAQLLEDYILSVEGQKVIGNIDVRFPARTGITDVKYSAETAVPGAQIKIFPSSDIATRSSALAANFKAMGFG